MKKYMLYEPRYTFIQVARTTTEYFTSLEEVGYVEANSTKEALAALKSLDYKAPIVQEMKE